jgi:hypothetical protein
LEEVAMKFTAYIGFTYDAGSDEEASLYSRLLLRSLDWSNNPQFDERLIESTFVERVEKEP